VRRMRLSALFEGLAVTRVAGGGDVAVTGVRDDSRLVERGDLFIARRGTVADGARFAADAAARGAAAVLAERPIEGLGETAQFTGDARGLTGVLAERFHGEPSRKLRLVGVTGTNGKSTTAWMVRHLARSTGRKCGLLSTVEVDVGGATPEAAKLTTPGACELSAWLAAMVDHGCVEAVMEVSSHALDQGRAAALAFDVGVFTNLTQDHLDYHHTMEAYGEAKAKLFKMLRGGRAVVNADDPWSERMVERTGAKVVRFGMGESADLRGSVEAMSARGMTVDVCWGGAGSRVELPLIGRYNVANLLGALGAAATEEIGLGALAEAATTMPSAPGRLERVSDDNAPFTLIVDYAHTDDALRNALAALRPLVPPGSKLRVVFGCGGDRDRDKRPRMASAACELADRVVVTSDNPRTESASGIIDRIMAGVPSSARSRVSAVVDRREAIERAVEEAGPGDVVVIAGKGHEDYQVIGEERRPFDDRVEARACLRDRFGDGASMEGQRS